MSFRGTANRWDERCSPKNTTNPTKVINMVKAKRTYLPMMYSSYIILVSWTESGPRGKTQSTNVTSRVTTMAPKPAKVMLPCARDKNTHKNNAKTQRTASIKRPIPIPAIFIPMVMYSSGWWPVLLLLSGALQEYSEKTQRTHHKQAGNNNTSCDQHLLYYFLQCLDNSQNGIICAITCDDVTICSTD